MRSLRSLCLLASLLAALLALAAADLQQMRAEPSAAEAQAATEPGETVADAALSAALSGCGLCQQTGYCDRAFRNSPGQFCLAMASGAPCCCPVGAQCAASPFDCRCRRVAAYGYPDAKPYQPHSSSSDSGSSFSTVLLILLLLCCVCCCWLPSHKRHREREETIHFAQPVHVDGQYGSGQPVYGYPGYSGYPTAPAYEPDNRSRRGEALAAGAAGAVGGLGLGALLGSWMNRGDSDRPNSSSSFFGGDTGGRYSQTFAGDTGGGYNNSQSSYTFGGDTGGDGGGTFSGDS